MVNVRFSKDKFLMFTSVRFLVKNSTVVKGTLYKSAARNICKMANAEKYSIAFVTISDKEAAAKLSDDMLQKKLVACVNIVSGVESRYVWEGKVNVDNEVLMIIKTRTSRLKELGDLIKDKHPYECPEFITTKIDDGNPAYLKWIGENVPEK